MTPARIYFVNDGTKDHLVRAVAQKPNGEWHVEVF